jgi:hypothetical protein
MTIASEIQRVRQEAEVARQSAETANELKSRLEIKLDFQKKYNERLTKSLHEANSRPPEKVEVPVMIEIVPENIRKRMSDLSRENRQLHERVEQLEMILSADGRELLLPS